MQTTLLMALDGRLGYPRELFSQQINGTWFVVNRGPRHCNTYEVTDADFEGIQRLLAIERAPELPPELPRG